MKNLADKLRPTSLDDIVGQSHILGEGKVLRKLIDNNNITNILLWGNPGIGKSTIASLLAQNSNKKIVKLNGSTASVKDIQEIAKNLNTLEGYDGYVLFFDELHLFSKNRQSSILSYIETGDITLIASTTENPYHSIHPAILSRCMVFELKPIENEDIVKRLEICIKEISDQNNTIAFDKDALLLIANLSKGDLRKAIGMLELIIKTSSSNNIYIDKDMVEELYQNNLVMDESKYYDYISMLQKSIRANRTDAALTALGFLIEGNFIDEIVRRLIITLSEDIGPACGSMYATIFSLLNAAKMVGTKECPIILSHAVILMSTCQKSNSAYVAIKEVMNDIRNNNIGDIQPYLKDAHYSGAKKLGITGYKYPHDYPNNYVEQEYMPENLKGKVYYKPGNNKYENAMKNYWDSIKNNNG